MGFQVGRANNNFITQAFNTGANLKLANEQLEEEKRQFDDNLLLKRDVHNLNQDIHNWDIDPDNPLNAHRILANQITQTSIDDAKKTKILDNVLQSGTGLLDDKNLFNYGGDSGISAADLFIQGDDGDYIVNPAYDATANALGNTTGKDYRVDIQNQLYDLYKDDIDAGTIDKGDIDEIIQSNWIGGDGKNIYGERYQAGGEAFNKYLSEAYSDDIQKDGIDVDAFNKMIGTNKEIFNTLSPGLMLAGQTADKLGYGLGGNTIPLNLTDYDKAKSLLSDYQIVQDTDGNYQYKKIKIDTADDTTDTPQNNPKVKYDTKGQGYTDLSTENTNKDWAGMFAEFTKSTNSADMGQYGTLGITQKAKGNDSAFYATLPIYGSLGGLLPARDFEEKEIRLDLDGRPYFDIEGTFGAKESRIYLDETWKDEGFKSQADYIKHQAQQVYRWRF